MPGEGRLFPQSQARLPARQSSCLPALLGGPPGRLHPLAGRLQTRSLVGVCKGVCGAEPRGLLSPCQREGHWLLLVTVGTGNPQQRQLRPCMHTAPGGSRVRPPCSAGKATSWPLSTLSLCGASIRSVLTWPEMGIAICPSVSAVRRASPRARSPAGAPHGVLSLRASVLHLCIVLPQLVNSLSSF